MPNIVVAGAGPIGLYTAILLRKRYPSVNVTVLDDRIGAFSRPGVIAKGALDAINDSFDKLGIPRLGVSECGSHPPAIHIKDLQQALYEKAESLGVTLIKRNYSAIEDKQVIVEDDDEGIPMQPLTCDLLIDCTGNDRVATEEVLGATDIADNPIKNHFLAYIYVDHENDALMNSFAPITPQSLRTFRENTGWSEFVAPEIDNPPRRWEGPLTHNEAEYAAKYCLYFEIPSNLKREHYSAYLHELLKLKYGKDIDFTASSDPGAFNKFEVSPKSLENFVGEIGAVPVVAVGDALVSAEYRYGTGIQNGVAGAYMLTRSLNWDGTKMSVDQSVWRRPPIDLLRYGGRNVDAVIGGHKERIREDYKSKQRTLQRAREEAYAQFRANPLETSDFDKVLFSNSSKEEGNILKKRGDDNFKNQQWDTSIISYLKAIELYEFCIKNSLEVDEIREARDKQIRTLSNLGRAFEKIGNIDEAINCFEKGIYMASDCGIIDMLNLDKIPKFLHIVADNKLLSFGENHLGKKEFLERLIECLSRTECDTTPYVQLLEETEKTISNIERSREFKRDIHQGRPDSNSEEMGESSSDSKEVSSIKNDGTI